MTSPIGVLLALAAALAWGSGDASGGLAARRSHVAVVVTWSAAVGVAMMTAAWLVTREGLPSLASAMWAASAGVAGALGLAALFRGLSVGRSALVAPTAGVIGAALPVLVGLVTEGALPIRQQTGLVIAIISIALVTRAADSGDGGRRGLGMATLAGLGFGGFFLLLARVDQHAVFASLAISRGGVLCVGLTIAAMNRVAITRLRDNRLALGAGALDAVGALCYLLAIRYVRTDVAAVLGSFYPAVTVILYRMVADERITSLQWLGLVCCVLAIGLIAGV